MRKRCASTVATRSAGRSKNRWTNTFASSTARRLHGIYDMVINHVERALIASVMDRAGGNQTQAADMLGMNRNTLRAKLVKYHIR